MHCPLQWRNGSGTLTTHCCTALISSSSTPRTEKRDAQGVSLISHWTSSSCTYTSYFAPLFCNSLECLDYVIYTPAFGSVALTLDCCGHLMSWVVAAIWFVVIVWLQPGGKHCDTVYNLTPCIQSTIFIFHIRFLHNHRYFTKNQTKSKSLKTSCRWANKKVVSK